MIPESHGKLGMWVFLTGDVMTFVVLFIGYAFFRFTLPEGSDAPAALSQSIGFCMTVLLACSSLAMLLSLRSLRQERRPHLPKLLLVTIGAGLAFLGLQGYEWQHLIGQGFGLSINPFGAPQFSGLFFMITGFHGLHVLVGIIYLLIIYIRPVSATSLTSQTHPIEIAGLYWQFVDGMWLFIFIGLYLL